MDDLSPLVADPSVEIFPCNGNISANVYSTILNQNGQEYILLFFLNKAFFFFLMDLEIIFQNPQLYWFCNSYIEPNPVLGIQLIFNYSIIL